MRNIIESHIDALLSDGLFSHEDSRSDKNSYKLNENSRVKLIVEDKEHIEFIWGEDYMIGTPAFWVNQAKSLPQKLNLRVGKSLREEIIFCILGGHGITFELNEAAFHALKREGLVHGDSIPSEMQIEAVLKQPLNVNGRIKPIRYRFPVMKSKRIHQALKILKSSAPPAHPLSLRNWLMTLPGIGYKTASWIVRDYLNSDLIAIIDIHVQRAGVAAGFFKPYWKLPNDYNLFEKAFLGYAKIGGVSASILDICIWEHMRGFGRHAKTLLPRQVPI